MDSPFEQTDMFPDLVPDIVARIWKAHQRHYRTGTHKPPTREQLRSYLEADPGEPASKSTIDRARKDYPKLLSPWPIKRGQHPAWLADPTVLGAALDAVPVERNPLDRVRWEAFDEHGARTTVEVVADTTGVLRLARVWRDTAGIYAASVAGVVMLDLMTDGKLDGVIRWCHILAKTTRSAGLWN